MEKRKMADDEFASPSQSKEKTKISIGISEKL
jgi:hypothetical protein